jgi:amino acid permease
MLLESFDGSIKSMFSTKPSIRNIFNNMTNELALFIAITVSCAILFMSTIIKGNIISAQANNNSSSVMSAAANKTAVKAQSAAANTSQAAKMAENKLEHAAKSFMNNTGHVTKQFIANITGTAKQFLLGGK